MDPLGRQNTEGCKNRNAFSVHHLTNRDEIWHNEGTLVRNRSAAILENFGPLFREHKYSTSQSSHNSCRKVTKFRQIDNYSPNFENFDPEEREDPRYHAATCISFHWCTCLLFLLQGNRHQSCLWSMRC